MSALASLKRLSPSRITSRRCGGRSCLSTVVAAAASGGATIAPSAIAAVQGMSGTSRRTTTATTPIVSATAPSARLADLAPVGAQVARRGVEGGVDQHGRDEQRERELGIEHERRHAGEERERGSGQRHQRRVRCAQPTRHGGEDRAAQEQRDDHLENGHECLEATPGRRYDKRSSCDAYSCTTCIGVTHFPRSWQCVTVITETHAMKRIP